MLIKGKNKKHNKAQFLGNMNCNPFSESPFAQYFDYQYVENTLFYNPNFCVGIMFNLNYFSPSKKYKNSIPREIHKRSVEIFKFGEIFWEKMLGYLEGYDLLNMGSSCRYIYIIIESYLTLNFFTTFGDFPPLPYSPHRFIASF